MTLRATAALSQHPVAAEALGECAGTLLEAASDAGAAPDLLAVTCTPPLHGALEDIVAAIRALLRPGAVVGAVATGVLGGGRQADGHAALAVMALWGRRCTPVRLDPADPAAGLRSLGPEPVGLFLLADPFSLDLQGLEELTGSLAPGSTVVAGLVGAGNRPGSNRLLGDDGVVSNGAVGVALGTASMSVRVARGAETFGPTWVVTGSESGLVTHLSGVPATDAVLRSVTVLDESRRERAETALALVVGTDASAGDVLPVRLRVGDTGLVVTDAPGPGATVRFALVDRPAAEIDLARTVDAATRSPALVLVGDGRVPAVDHATSDAAILAESTRGAPTWGLRTVGSLVRDHGAVQRPGEGGLAVGSLH